MSNQKEPFNVRLQTRLCTVSPWLIGSCGLIGLHYIPWDFASLTIEEIQRFEANIIKHLIDVHYHKLDKKDIPRNFIFNTTNKIPPCAFTEYFNTTLISEYVNPIHDTRNYLYMNRIPGDIDVYLKD